MESWPDTGRPFALGRSSRSGNEREDELKSLLKDTFGPIDEEDVSEISSIPMVTSTRHLSNTYYLLLREVFYRDRESQDTCMWGGLPQ